ncbi:MAG: hypothetical protein K2M43_01520, partial [Mycoplasmoidaceae bacterium]|nr:hypothetical protein [Mycoplasmoidaceae bacterium]
MTDNKKEFYTNCSTIIKIGEDQKEAIAAYCDPDDYTYDKVSPPVMCTSNIYTIESEGAMYLENIGHKFTGNWDNSQFIIHMNGNLFSEVPGQNYQLFNAFHYITISDQKIGSPTQIPCFFTDGMKTLLEAVFPEYPNINPVIN